jgi:hypothetical protein
MTVESTVVLHVADLPEVMEALRHEMADVLRDTAREGQAPEEARLYLWAVADTFEGRGAGEVKES